MRKNGCCPVVSQDLLRQGGSYRTGGVPLSDQRGTILISLIITLTLIAIAGAGLVSFTTTSTWTEIFANRQERAYYIAESGGRYAIPQIRLDPVQAATNLHGQTFTLSNGDKFTLSVNNTSNDYNSYLKSLGIVQEGTWLEARVEITYRIPIPYRFEYGMFSGTNRITLDNNAYIDSYDSSVAAWSVGTRRLNGHVGTNRTGNRSIDVKVRSIIYGNATVGVGGNPATDIDVAANALITGVRGSLSTSRDMTPRIMPSGGGTPYDLLLGGTTAQSLSDGTFRLNRMELNDDAVLSIAGNVTLYVLDRIWIQDRAKIDIQPGGSLTIYAARELVVNTSAALNPTQGPGKFIIFGTSSFSTIAVTDDSVVSAAIFAPSANAVIQRRARVFGSVIARGITLQGNAEFHYDEALGRSAGAGGPTTQYF